MKKFYITLLTFLLCLVALAAQGKTVTVVTNDIEAMYVTDPATYQRIPWNEETKSVEVTLSESDYSILLRAISGYTITSATNLAGFNFAYSAASNVAVYNSELVDGDVVTCTVKEKEPKVFVCKADPTMIYLTLDEKDYGAAEQVDGAWTVNMTDDSYLYINAYPDYMISSIKDQNGSEMAYRPTTSSYVSGYSLSDGTTTYTVEAYNLNDARTESFILEVEGDPGLVSVRRNEIYQDIPLDGATTEIRFNPETELPITIESAEYGVSLYKVLLNDQPVEASGSSWRITPANGDIVKVITDFPDINAPVKITLTNEGTEDAINVSVDNEAVPASEWQSPDFSVKLGSLLAISFNQNKYDVTLTENGSPIYSYGSYAITVKNENGYNFEVTATPIPTYKVTVKCTDPAHINGYYGYGTAKPITLTGDSTEIEVSQRSSYLHFLPAPDAIFTEVTTSTEEIFSNLNEIAFNVSGDMTITFATAPYERTMKGVVYLAKGDSPTNENGWDYAAFTLKQGAPQEKSMALDAGYNFFDFNELDKPFYLGLYPDVNAVYFNNEQIWPKQYSNTYPELDNFASGDVIKIYPAEVTPVTVTNEIQDGLTVAFTTDHITAQPDNVAELSVLPGTFYTIAPTSASEGTVLVVTVNDTPIEAVDGVYSTTIEADTKVIISAKSALEGIGVDSASGLNDVYNLQGILVKSAATPDQIKALPAGLYIIGGRKFIVR